MHLVGCTGAAGELKRVARNGLNPNLQFGSLPHANVISHARPVQQTATEADLGRPLNFGDSNPPIDTLKRLQFDVNCLFRKFRHSAVTDALKEKAGRKRSGRKNVYRERSPGIIPRLNANECAIGDSFKSAQLLR